MGTTKRLPILWLSSLLPVVALLMAGRLAAGQSPAPDVEAMLAVTTLNPVADAYVDSETPNTLYGNVAHLWLGYTDPPQVLWSYLRFDLDGGLPDNVVIDSATLVLSREELACWPVGSSISFGAYRITGSWTEGTLTYNTRPAITSQSAGGTRSYTCGQWPSAEWSWGITDMARVWYADPSLNRGVIIQGPASGENELEVQFSSDEGSPRPRLDVTWHYVPTSTPTRTRTPTRTPTGGPTATPTRTRTPGGATRKTYLPIVMKQHLALGAPIFSDNFNAGSITGWTPNNGIWTNPGAYMRGEHASGDAWNIRGTTGTNFTYEARVNILSGDGAGLVFRSSENGATSYDAWLNAASGALQIRRRSPAQVLASIPVAVQRNHQYRLRVVATGSSIEAWLDGEKRLTATDSGLTSGRFGVIVSRGSAAYDDVRAWALP